MTESPESSVASDLPTAPEDSEAMITALSSKISKLKSLLVKAKVSINDFKRKGEEYERRIAEERNLSALLREKIARIEEPPGVEDVICVKARVKVEEEVWVLVRTVRLGNRWYSAASLHLPSSSLPEVLDSSCSQAYVNDVVKQYEDRLLRLQASIDNYEDNNRDLQKAYKSLQEAYKDREADIQSSNYLLATLEPSQSLLENLTLWAIEDDFRADSLPSIQQQAFNFVNSSSSSTAQSDQTLRKQLSEWHSLVLDVARRLAHCRKEQQAQESAWKATCDLQVNEKEEIKGSLNRVRSDFARKIEEYDRKLAGLAAACALETSELRSEIARLQEEAKSGVNTAYLRHVVVQFLTSSDLGMQERLIHVLATVLEFSPEEQVLVRRHRTPKGVLTRWLGA